MSAYLTLSTNNQFKFECPVFNAQTKMASCMALREAVWMGKQIDKRKGCQAAMRCGMCPAAKIVDKISYSREPVSDDYGSLEPKLGRLHADILHRIERVIPIMSVLDRSEISEDERNLLLTTHPRIQAQLKTAPGRDGKSTAFINPRRMAPVADTTPVIRRSSAPKTDTTINEAARTGDMSAAINAAAA